MVRVGRVAAPTIGHCPDGGWCNWQHYGFWSRQYGFESCPPSHERPTTTLLAPPAPRRPCLPSPRQHDLAGDVQRHRARRRQGHQDVLRPRQGPPRGRRAAPGGLDAPDRRGAGAGSGRGGGRPPGGPGRRRPAPTPPPHTRPSNSAPVTPPPSGWSSLDPCDVVVVLPGDMPLIRPETIASLVTTHIAAGAAATVLSVDLADPYGYGRVLRDARRCGHRRSSSTVTPPRSSGRSPRSTPRCTPSIRRCSTRRWRR